jgi:hypothetical protein
MVPSGQAFREGNVGSPTGYDYAWSHPSIAALRAVHATFVSRYLCWPNARSAKGKLIEAPEYRALTAAGINVLLNWEFDAHDALRGASGGVFDARMSVSLAKGLGYPAGAALTHSYDFDATPGQMSKLGAYAYQVRELAHDAGYLAGGYGGYWVIKYLFDHGLIDVGWQAYAWSDGLWDSRAQLRQIRNGVRVGGADTDLDIMVKPVKGSLGGAIVIPKPQPAPTPAPLPTPTIPGGFKMKDLFLVQDGKGGVVYAGNGVLRKWVRNPTELDNLRYWISRAGGNPTVNLLTDGDPYVAGELIAGQVYPPGVTR